MNNQNKPESIDKNRRKFLTVMLIGSGAFLVEKILTPLFARFLNNPPAKTSLSPKTSFMGFQVAENKKSLSVYDSSGEEILQIDKEA
jgi:hypothetical protein